MALSLVRLGRELWKFGSHERVTRGTPIGLFGQNSTGAGETRYTTFRQFGATVGYTVTAGQLLVLTRLIVYCNTTAGIWQFGSGTSDVGESSLAAPTDYLPFDSSSATNRNPWVVTTNEVHLDREIHYTVAAGRLPAYNNINASKVLVIHLYGHEIPA